MPVDDQSAAGDRQQRWLCRALIVVGGTVASISAAWLLGSAQAAASDVESVEDRGALVRVDRSSTGQHERTSERDRRRTERVDGPLRGLARALTGKDGANDRSVPDEDRRRPGTTGDSVRESHRENRYDGGAEPVLALDPVLAPVSERVEKVRREADPVLRPVDRVTGKVLSEATGAESVTGVVESGWDGVRESLGADAAEHVTSESEQHSERFSSGGAERAPSSIVDNTTHFHPESDEFSGPELSETKPSLAGRSFTAGTAVFASADDIAKHSGQRLPAHRSGGFPPFPSGDCSCSTDATTSGAAPYIGFGLAGWTPALPNDSRELGSSAKPDTSSPVNSDGPQPGVTPD